MNHEFEKVSSLPTGLKTEQNTAQKESNWANKELPYRNPYRKYRKNAK